MKRLCIGVLVLIFVLNLATPTLAMTTEEKSRAEVLKDRLSYYLKYEALTLVPWYFLVAVDQYERNVQLVRKDIPKRDGTIAIQFSSDYWAGPLNLDENDNHLESIDFFDGQGKDGNGDGLADRNNDDDILFTMSHYLSTYGYTYDDFKIALWNYYQREETVRQITTMAKIYRHFGTLDLYKRCFPLPLSHIYSYRSTWGDRRGWGGRRIHEGTDIFASYGVPVRSTTYGIVEIRGWNKYGGWRVGIRDIHNVYHYYAHLSGFNDEIKEGSIVEPGTIVGYVGSSGYGKPGTSGKFPPHLHYGMYKDNGRTEWSFDPYPYLRLWEKEERVRKRKKK